MVIKIKIQSVEYELPLGFLQWYKHSKLKKYMFSLDEYFAYELINEVV